MPDPIRCLADPSSPRTFTCDPVEIGPETDTPANTAPAPVSSQAAGVDQLVKRFLPAPTVVVAPAVERLTTETLEHCAGKLLAWAPLFLKPSNITAAALGAAKASYELAQCIDEDTQRRERVAAREAGIRVCEAHDGIVLGEVGNVLTCAVSPGPVKP